MKHSIWMGAIIALIINISTLSVQARGMHHRPINYECTEGTVGVQTTGRCGSEHPKGKKGGINATTAPATNTTSGTSSADSEPHQSTNDGRCHFDQTPDEEYHMLWKGVQDNLLYRNRLAAANWAQYEHPGHFDSFEAAEKFFADKLKLVADQYTYLKSPALDSTIHNDNEPIIALIPCYLQGKTIGYIPLKCFDDQAADQLEEALQTLSEAQTYIVDMRDNPGGDGYQMALSYSLLADSGTVATLKGFLHGKPLNETLSIHNGVADDNINGAISHEKLRCNLTGNKPMIVLVNDQTASAAETLACALHDNGRAIVLGTKTYGKGVAEAVLQPRPGTYLCVTCALWYRPQGTCINGTGMQPDIVVERNSDMADSQLRAAIKYLQQKLSQTTH